MADSDPRGIESGEAPACPHCRVKLSEQDIKRLWGALSSGKRKFRRGARRKLTAVERQSVKVLSKKYPQAMLARELGVSRSLVSRIVRGLR